jgi:hypothetical protein
MQEFITSETTKIFSSAIKRYAKEDKIEEKKVSVLLHLADDEDERKVGYKICHNHSPVKDVSIMQILGRKIDLKGYSLIVPPQIKKIIEGFEEELGKGDVEVCVYLDRVDDDEVLYFLYKSGELVRKFNLEDVIKIEI